MDLIDFSKGQIWAILPNQLTVMMEAVHQIRKDSDRLAEMIAKFKTQRDEKSDYRLKNGVAIIPIVGPISKRETFFSFFFGGSSTQALARIMDEAIQDPDVEAIVLDIDSPGGTVSGTEAFGNMVYEARNKKPIVSFANGMMASAAYWIGSGANAIVAESTADIGSIGVLMVHYDFSEWDKQIGVKRTFLSAGKYKALGNSAEPLSQIAREVFESELDYIYSLFVETVARNLGANIEIVLADMADGKIFIGQQAVDAGLADRTGSLDDAIDLALSLTESAEKNIFQLGGLPPGKETIMSKEQQIVPKTTEQLAELYPELVAQVRKQGADGVNVDELTATAKKEEKDRILGLASIQFGEEAGEKFKAVVDSGVSVEQFKAVREINPPKVEDTAKQEMLEAIKKAGAENPGTGDGSAQAGGKDFMTLVEEYQTARKCGKVEAMQIAMKKHPEAHKAYIEKAQTLH